MRPNRAGRRPAAATTALLAVFALAGAGGAQEAGATCSVPNQVVTEPDGWTRIRAPQFSAAPQELTAYAVDPLAPERLFATNGRVLRRSTDGGCTWVTVLSIDQNPTLFPFPAATAMHSIVIPAEAAASGRFHYVVVREEHGGGIVRPGVLRSSGGGGTGTWERTFLSAGGETGELPLGDPIELMVPDASPDTLYLAAAAGSNAGTVLYVSRDAGVGWRPVFPEDALEQGRLVPVFSDARVDPLDPDQLWGTAADGLWQSRDGGRRWERIPTADAPGPLGVVDVFAAPGTPSRIWALGPPTPSFRSDDGGGTWREMPGMSGGLLQPDSAAHGENPDDVFATARDPSGGWALGFDAGAGGWQPLKNTPAALSDASADRASPPSFYARTGDRIYRSPPFAGGFVTPAFEGGLAPPPPPPPSPPPPPDGCPSDEGKDDSGAGGDGLASLAPAQVHVALSPGEARQVPYELSLPGGGPLDVYFVIDTTGSMGGAIEAARDSASSIADALSESGLDVRFGVADYRDYPVSPYGELGDYPYRRVRDIGPMDGDFHAALSCLRATGGGDEPESQLTALYQTATGAGQAPWIQTGQGASFRPGALAVALNITDASFHGEPGYPGPGWEATLSALQAKEIRQVGLSFRNSVVDELDSALADEILVSSMRHLRRVARATGAIATAPVDCDGDGSGDIPAGGPLVCPAEGSSGPRMADAVVGMVLALEDRAPVRLVETTDSGVVDGIEPAVHPAVNLRENNSLPFDVTYTCTEEQAGLTLPVELAAKVRSEVVATAEAVVTCLGDLEEVVPSPAGLAAAPPVVPPPPVPPLAPTGPALVPGPAPAPAPVPGPAPQPQPQSQAQPNPQPNPQAQAGLAAQKQEQTQTAVVTAGQQNASQEEYAMSTRRRDPIEAAKWPAAIGGAVLGLAFGCMSVAARRREQRAEIRR